MICKNRILKDPNVHYWTMNVIKGNTYLFEKDPYHPEYQQNMYCGIISE